MSERFRNRSEAGRELAQRLTSYANRDDVVVLALPRGGVPVAFEIATALAAPLDVFVVRKLGVPGQEELAMGAIASGGLRVLNEEVLATISISRREIDEVAAREAEEIRRRDVAYRGDRSPIDVSSCTVIVVDDGLATGSTMRAAVLALRRLGAARIVVAVPAAPRPTCEELSRAADEVVCLRTPEPFYAVGEWYDDFSQTSDEEVKRLLAAAANGRDSRSAGERPVRADARS